MAYIDLHRHVEGSISPFVARKTNLSVSSYWDGTVPFFDIWPPIIRCLTTSSKYGDVLYYSLEEIAKLGTMYAEYMFSPAESDLSPYNIAYAMKEASMKAEARFGIHSSLIYNLTRHFPKSFEQELEAVSQLYDDELIAAVGLAGDEITYHLRDLALLLRHHLRDDIPKAFHTGEFSDGEDIRIALDLGATRLGHAVKLAGNDELCERVKAAGVGIEVCLTSEIKLGGAPTLEAHPIFEFAERGLLFNINTDDPAVFASEIDAEYALVAHRIDPKQLNENAITMSFAPEKLKQKLRSMV